MNALVDPGDQIELPSKPLDLPDAQRGKRQEAGDTQGGQQQPLRPVGAHGILFICVELIPGIMFELRWYMIHSEPVIVISRMTPVNK